MHSPPQIEKLRYNVGILHCVKSVQIRRFFWSVFSRIRTEYGPEKTLYLDTFHTVLPAAR